jgi:hypothetical protein
MAVPTGRRLLRMAKDQGQNKVPHYLVSAKDNLLAFAGLYVLA